MADVVITEPTNRTTEPLICITAVITIGDGNTSTVNDYFGEVIGLTILYNVAALPDADWDLRLFDEKLTDLTAGNGEGLDGTTTDMAGHLVQQFGITDMGGGVPVQGKIWIGEDGMATADATATVYIYIMPSIPQRGLIQ